MPDEVISLARFREILPSLCDEKTAYKSGIEWSSRNPTFGHCSVVALTVQLLYGGEIHWVSLAGTPFSKLVKHFWNILPDETLEDLTFEQFEGKCVYMPSDRQRCNITDILSFPDTRARYFEFLRRLMLRL